MSKELVKIQKTEELSTVKKHRDPNTTTFNIDIHGGTYHYLSVVWFSVMGTELKKDNTLYLAKKGLFCLGATKTLEVTSIYINSRCNKYMLNKKIHPVHSGNSKANMYPTKNLKKFLKQFLKKIRKDAIHA